MPRLRTEGDKMFDEIKNFIKRYEIEKDYPIPKIERRHKYPFKDMEIGDSFFAPFEDGVAPERVRVRIINAAKVYDPMKFITRKVDGGFRVWRIS
jgi:hypothetical protein